MDKTTPAKPDTTAAASAQTPSIGRVVHYRLSKSDAQEINKRRKRFQGAPAQVWGFQAHVGNRASAGDVFPAVIVRVFGDNPGANTTVNLQVQLDGNDTYWATSRARGEEDGQWSWPVKV